MNRTDIEIDNVRRWLERALETVEQWEADDPTDLDLAGAASAIEDAVAAFGFVEASK